MKTIVVTINKSGDWVVIQLNGEVYEEGHSIPMHTWMSLIHELGNEVTFREVPDEDMAYGTY